MHLIFIEMAWYLCIKNCALQLKRQNHNHVDEFVQMLYELFIIKQSEMSEEKKKLIGSNSNHNNTIINELIWSIK